VRRLEAEARDARAELKKLAAELRAKDKAREDADLRAIKAEAALDSERMKGKAEASKGSNIAKVRCCAVLRPPKGSCPAKVRCCACCAGCALR
jgi:hypothetical protein